MAQDTKSLKILNIKQLAQHIAVPLPTVRYWLKQGRCPVEPIAGMKPPKWRITDVEMFLAGKK